MKHWVLYSTPKELFC